MELSRRGLMGMTGGLASGLAGAAVAAPSLPDKVNFPFEGTYLDAAFTHPFGVFAAAGAASYAQGRLAGPQAVGPRGNPRRGAIERFARLINADPADIAVVPSTLDGENLVNAALGIGPGAGVVTDALHYDASLVLYGEQAKRGAPVAVARPKQGRVDIADLRDLITRETRLVAVSLISSDTGFQHDLAELCALAHARGALVYADIIQAAGAVPVDVRATGVDFACCGTYKWLMGDFGAAFLYVRPDRLDRLKRVEVGWRQVRRQASHVFPFEPEGPAIGAYDLAPGAAGLFEVSTPAWGSLAIVSTAMDYVLNHGVAAIARHRQPLVDHLQEALSKAPGFVPLTSRGSESPIVAFAVQGAQARFAARLKTQGIGISVYENRLRISPSVYNDIGDVEHLIRVLMG